MKIGVDIVDLRRLDITNRHFVERILTPNELLVFDNKATSKQKREYLGGRFAGKEAVMKAFCKGIGEMSFQQIEILNNECGAPYLNIENANISISHEKNYVVAFVVMNE